MTPDVSVREHRYVNTDRYQFHVETYAPSTHTDPQTKMKTVGKPRFNVEMSEYVSSVGWDQMDMEVAGNEAVYGFIKKVQFYEAMGYEHNGLSSEELIKNFEKMWGKFEAKIK